MRWAGDQGRDALRRPGDQKWSPQKRAAGQFFQWTRHMATICTNAPVHAMSVGLGLGQNHPAALKDGVPCRGICRMLAAAGRALK